jgi:hypothetical protein
MGRCFLLLPLLLSLCVASDEELVVVAVDGNGDLVVTPHQGASVFFRDVDILASATSAVARVAVLETKLQLVAPKLVTLTNPSSATCSCEELRGDCTPAVRFPNGSVACCMSDQSNTTCRWTGLGSITSASAQCNVSLFVGGLKDVPNPLLGFNDKVFFFVKLLYKRLLKRLFALILGWILVSPSKVWRARDSPAC